MAIEFWASCHTFWPPFQFALDLAIQWMHRVGPNDESYVAEVLVILTILPKMQGMCCQLPCAAAHHFFISAPLASSLTTCMIS